MFYSHLLFLVIVPFAALAKPENFSDITDASIGQQANTSILALADYNSDRKTDLIAFRKASGEIIVISGTDKGTQSQVEVINRISGDLAGIIAADFDGDLLTDFLLCSHDSDNFMSLKLCYHDSKEGFTCSNEFDIQTKIHPMVFDVNLDMLPDVYITDVNDTLHLFISNKNRKFTVIEPSALLKSTIAAHPFRPNHNSFISATQHDLYALNLETVDGVFRYDSKRAEIRGQIKWQNKGLSSHISPLSSDSFVYAVEGTANSSIDIYTVSGLEQPTDSFTKTKYTLHDYNLSPLHLYIKTADIDNSGEKDLIMIVTDVLLGKHTAIVLSPDSQDGYSQKYFLPPTADKLIDVLIYDVYGDGKLDIIYTVETTTGTEIIVYENLLAPDSNFVKIQVGSSWCPKDDDRSCPYPYTNIIGATINMTTTLTNGALIYRTNVQLSESNTMWSKSLPYIHIGLGKEANYIEAVSVRLFNFTGGNVLERTWNMLLPNSHIVVVPNPLLQPSHWTMHLYIIPSKMVLSTGLVMLGVCGLLGIIVAALHYKEKRDDRADNMKASQYHFNTM